MPQPGITFRTIGGLLEFFVFLGPEPESVVQQYTGLIGRTFMPPYFALGFQLSRWGYQNTEEIRQVINRTKFYEIPQVIFYKNLFKKWKMNLIERDKLQDIQYADIDYMDRRRDFTLDPVNFPDLPQLVDEVKMEGLRFIVIFDPAIAVGYVTFERGLAANVFIEWANSTIKPSNQPTDDDYLLGRVWPTNRTAFPDFFKSSTQNWWTEEIKSFYETLKFDSIWIVGLNNYLKMLTFNYIRVFKLGHERSIQLWHQHSR